jgi:hypothetical protein
MTSCLFKKLFASKVAFEDIIKSNSFLSCIDEATAEGLLFQGVDLFVFKGGDVLGLITDASKAAVEVEVAVETEAELCCLYEEEGAEIDATGEGGQTSFNKFRISSGVISKSGLLFVYGKIAFFCTSVNNKTCSHTSY